MNLLYSNDKRGTYPESWYAATTEMLDEFPDLKGEQTADLCVIGGGYTGLWAALQAAKNGMDVVLLDAQRVGFGASGRNGGQVGTGFNKNLQSLEKALGKDDAVKLWEMAETAKRQTIEFCRDAAPEANFTSGIIHADWLARDVPDSHDTAQHLQNDYGYDSIQTLKHDEISDLIGTSVYAGGTLDKGAGHLHPLRYAIALAREAVAAGVRIFEQTYVHGITQGARVIVKCDLGRVVANHVIIATNGYGTGLDRATAARVMPINNFIVATEPLHSEFAGILKERQAVADSRFVVNYFRISEDNRLLFGGGESYGYKFPANIEATVRKPLEQVFPQLRGVKIDYGWGGTLAITMSRLPYISRPAPNILSAAGYSGHGVALSGFIGKLLADVNYGQASGFELLEKLPTPGFPGGSALRSPLLALAMTWYASRDKLGL